MRQDALSAITLVESAATLTTQGIFGLIFATLSEIGKPNLTFFVNAVSVFPLFQPMPLLCRRLLNDPFAQALAVVAVGILLLAHYPPAEATRIENEEPQENSSVRG